MPTGRIHRVRWLKWTLAIVGGLWLRATSFWAVGLVDQIKTDIYQAQHHYRLDKAAVLAGIEIPRGSWVSIDEEGSSTRLRRQRAVWCRSMARCGGAISV
jgi:hypothetical protein